VTTPPGATSGDAASGDAPSDGASASNKSGSLAFTGIDIQRDAEIGAALIAGGWAMHHWASRTPKATAEARTDAARRTETPA
jgi:hypothetical protein